jgi:hypothetical protein
VRHFLIDASALIAYFLPVKAKDEALKRAVVKLLSLRAERRAILRVPNFCMAECAKGIANILFENVPHPSKKFDQAQARLTTMRELYLEMVSKKKKGLIQSLALDRKHLVNIENILEAQFMLNPRDFSQRLSGLDALVIAMGASLARSVGREKVFIVTGDKWMAHVCEQTGAPLPRAIYAAEQPIPDG